MSEKNRCKFCDCILTKDNWYPTFTSVNRRLCKNCQKSRAHRYYSLWNEKTREKARLRARNWKRNHRELTKEIWITTQKKLKHEVLLHYSKVGSEQPNCVVCGFSDIRALSIDHINNNGAEERRRMMIKSGHIFYRFLRKNGYPSGYQTLCMNCQSIKQLS